jgi:hypothetical protein
MRDLNPNFLNPNLDSWDAYWDRNAEAQNYLNISDPWGKLIPLMSPTNNELFLVFLHTEAIKTYSLLNQFWGSAHAVVIQDHGNGNFWTKFGGESKLYSCASNDNKLPEFIYLDSNTDCWPNYVQHEEFEECIDMYGGQCQKAIFKRSDISKS